MKPRFILFRMGVVLFDSATGRMYPCAPRGPGPTLGGLLLLPSLRPRKEGLKRIAARSLKAELESVTRSILPLLLILLGTVASQRSAGADPALPPSFEQSLGEAREQVNRDNEDLLELKQGWFAER